METLLRDEEWGKWSAEEISRRCMVSGDLVLKMRKELGLTSDIGSEKTYTTKHGTTATMNTANIGKRHEDDPK